MELTLDTIAGVKIYQNKNGYRFSVDALVLYSFINLEHAKKIADLGAGSGIVGILLAKKYQKAKVELVELQESLAILAEKNIALNNLGQRTSLINCNIKDIPRGIVPLKTNSFDLVASNPPFRRQKTGLISPTDEKAIARHEIKLGIDDILKASFYLLRNKGRLCIVYHPSRIIELIDKLRAGNLEPKRIRFVHSNPASEAKMVLIEAVKNGRPEIKIEKPLFIYHKPVDTGNGENIYTDEMKKIYDQ